MNTLFETVGRLLSWLTLLLAVVAAFWLAGQSWAQRAFDWVKTGFMRLPLWGKAVVVVVVVVLVLRIKDWWRIGGKAGEALGKGSQGIIGGVGLGGAVEENNIFGAKRAATAP